MPARILRPKFGPRVQSPCPSPSRTCLSRIEADLSEASAFHRDVRSWCPEAGYILNRAYTRYFLSLLAALRAEFGDLTLRTRQGVGVVRVERTREASHGE